MKFLKRAFFIAGSFLIFGGMLIWGQLSALPASLTIQNGKAHALPAFVAPRAAEAGFLLQKNGNNVSITPTKPGNYNIDFSALGLFRKTVNVNVVQEESVILGGELLGIKMYMDGALVIGLSEIPGTGRAPGKEAGIRAGDRIVSVNGLAITDSEILETAVEKSGGAAVILERYRDGERKSVTVSPVYYHEGEAYKLGIWIRDSTAGVGTLTFIKPESGKFGALGHAIADYDTGEVVSVSEGSVTDCRAALIEKGERGAPGAVQGTFGEDVGTIEKNTETGVYGTFFGETDRQALPIALSASVTTGPATIYSDIAGGAVQGYEAEITKVFHHGRSETKSMCIRITDPSLLALTGGIIQGMSGSPILQNGRIVGAVTHVFVNDPTRGYGIFIENMLAEAEKIK